MFRSMDCRGYYLRHFKHVQECDFWEITIELWSGLLSTRAKSAEINFFSLCIMISYAIIEIGWVDHYK